ncbi:probable cysteine--tRNA ligase, mitochondrial [Octodon degus]|uniref:Probable cysteine--tRNA ligase, mitochondrial n=1 Tax=Octodon degus TaxID=10160 RepID=A0A6P6EF62_OCTDE|nr:probable cysteine--tRNA ligase, mitochondrial [Octodon degus]
MAACFPEAPLERLGDKGPQEGSCSLEPIPVEGEPAGPTPPRPYPLAVLCPAVRSPFVLFHWERPPSPGRPPLSARARSRPPPSPHSPPLPPPRHPDLGLRRSRSEASRCLDTARGLAASFRPRLRPGRGRAGRCCLCPAAATGQLRLPALLSGRSAVPASAPSAGLSSPGSARGAAPASQSPPPARPGAACFADEQLAWLGALRCRGEEDPQRQAGASSGIRGRGRLRARGGGVGPAVAWTRAGAGRRPAGCDTGVRVHNSLTGRKEPLVVARADAVFWYSCGPTVYDHAHLGHACSYVRFDVIRRLLTKVFGCSVVMVMGITDVDDKIIRRASEMDVSPVTLARLYEEDFKQDMAALKVLPPTVSLRVTETIPQIIAFIQGIMGHGHAYATERGNVYFELRSRGDKYGKLSGMVPCPATEAVDSDKRYAGDFALWKAARPGEVSWASPWGHGRPGWHIECSTIASAVFGSHLDVHSGGVDLAFPHHENEIAQCEAFHQCAQWGNYFLHSGHLHVKGQGQKMSKSLKNYVTIKDFLQSFSPDVFRLFCLRSSYRSAIDYSDSTMLEASHVLRGLASFVEDARAYIRGQLAGGPVSEAELWDRLSRTQATVQAALADDFDTLRAVDAILDLVRLGNRQLRVASEGLGGPRSPAVLGATVAYVEQFFETVGISLASQQCHAQCVAGDSSTATLHSVVDELVRFRLKVRQFALDTQAATGDARRQQLQERQPLLDACDTLRQDLAAHGISIKDRSSVASTWELLDPRTAQQKPGG